MAHFDLFTTLSPKLTVHHVPIGDLNVLGSTFILFLVSVIPL